MKPHLWFDARISGIANNIANSFFRFFISERATIVISAFNEQETIHKVVKAALKSQWVGEVIVVDDGSTDKTTEIVKRFSNVKLVSHKRNLGKGMAIKTGIEHASKDIVFFLDADLQNITPYKIDCLLLPLLHEKADFVKAGFSLKRGRVTEIAVKPMMRILFPNQEFSQPISGQFGARKNFLSELKFVDRWGIDIAIFLDALKKGMRVVEVDIGELVHKARSAEEKAEMSKQVMETMLRKAGVFADYFHTIVFSEFALFDGEKPKQEAAKVIARLKKRRFTVLVLGYGSPQRISSRAQELNVDDYLAASPSVSPMDLLRFFKKAIKRRGLKINQIVFVACQASEAILLNAAGYGIAFGKDRMLRKKANLVINSLAEVLLLEE